MSLLNVVSFLLLVGFCDSGTGLKCYSCMFPDDSWCKDTANLKFQEEAKTQQICPEHVKQCGYSKIVDDHGNEMVFRTCGGKLHMDNKCEIFDEDDIKTTVCYCGETLCNTSSAIGPNLLLVFIILRYVV